MAREELRLVREATKRGVTCGVNVNADLCRAFPHRSMDAIKGLRKKLKYLSLRARLGDEEKESPPVEPPESPERVFSVWNEGRKWTIPVPKGLTSI